MSRKLSLVLSFSFLFFAGCKKTEPGHGYQPRDKVEVSAVYQGSYPIRVVCTTGMVADLVRNVGGPQVLVEQLMHHGVDPHQYKPTPGDMEKLQNADLVFYSGLHLEGKMTDALQRLAKKLPAFPVAEYLKPSHVLQDEDQAADPHVWFDVSLWSQSAGVVGEVLSLFDSNHAHEYQERLKIYQAELEKLHQYARDQLAGIPTERRVLVTSHDAFRYFGKAYGLEVRGIQGISTEAEASVKDINDLVRFIAQRKIRAVFVETSVNPEQMKALIEGCKAKGHEVVQGGQLFSDAMGPVGTPEGTYVGMVRHNVDTIVKALR